VRSSSRMYPRMTTGSATSQADRCCLEDLSTAHAKHQAKAVAHVMWYDPREARRSWPLPLWSDAALL
jgi:hypothetical protein